MECETLRGLAFKAPLGSRGPVTMGSYLSDGLFPLLPFRGAGKGWREGEALSGAFL